MSDLVACWLYTRPGVRRMWLIVQIIWGAAVTAVSTAPTASAQTLGMAWSFTGLQDSYHIPIGQHFASLPPLLEMVGANGPQFGANPQSWTPAVMSSLETAMTYAQLKLALSAETAFLIGVCAIGIWLIKFALGVLWLSWLGAIANPVVTSLQSVVERLHLLAGGVLVSFLVGGMLCLTTGFASGIGVIVGGLIAVLVFSIFLRDPAGDLVSDHGVLGIGRSLGFTLAQGVVHNGPVAGGGTSAQLDTLTSWMVDVLVRDVLELINFGQVIDDVPHCAELYNAALLRGADVAQAVRGCAPGAYTQALQLDATAAGMFFIANCCVLVILWSLGYMGIEAFRVGFKAFWNVLIVVPAAAAAAFPGPPRRFAKKAGARVLLHGAEMMAATAGLGILVMIIGGVTHGWLPGTIGMTAPLAKILVMMLLAVVGSLAFRFALLRAFGDQGIPGPVRVIRGGYRAARATTRTAYDIDSGARVVKAVGSGLKGAAARRRGAQSQGEEQGNRGTVGVGAPGRKGHPPTSGPGRPDGGPQAGAASGPAPSRPGGGSPGGGAAAAPPTSNRRAASGNLVPTAAATGRAAGARAAATVVAPEVAVPVAAATSLAHRAAGKQRRPEAEAHPPGRSGGAAPPAKQGPRPASPPNRSGGLPQRHDGAPPPASGDAPPRRTTPKT